MIWSDQRELRGRARDSSIGDDQDRQLPASGKRSRTDGRRELVEEPPSPDPVLEREGGGLNAGCTSFRYFACSGGSMWRIDWRGRRRARGRPGASPARQKVSGIARDRRRRRATARPQAVAVEPRLGAPGLRYAGNGRPRGTRGPRAVARGRRGLELGSGWSSLSPWLAAVGSLRRLLRWFASGRCSRRSGTKSTSSSDRGAGRRCAAHRNPKTLLKRASPQRASTSLQAAARAAAACLGLIRKIGAWVGPSRVDREVSRTTAHQARRPGREVDDLEERSAGGAGVRRGRSSRSRISSWRRSLANVPLVEVE
jgi:hypothetical protein